MSGTYHLHGHGNKRSCLRCGFWDFSPVRRTIRECLQSCESKPGYRTGTRTATPSFFGSGSLLLRSSHS